MMIFVLSLLEFDIVRLGSWFGHNLIVFTGTDFGLISTYKPFDVLMDNV